MFKKSVKKYLKNNIIQSKKMTVLKLKSNVPKTNVKHLITIHKLINGYNPTQTKKNNKKQ